MQLAIFAKIALLTPNTERPSLTSSVVLFLAPLTKRGLSGCFFGGVEFISRPLPCFLLLGLRFSRSLFLIVVFYQHFWLMEGVVSNLAPTDPDPSQSLSGGLITFVKYSPNYLGEFLGRLVQITLTPAHVLQQKTIDLFWVKGPHSGLLPRLDDDPRLERPLLGSAHCCKHQRSGPVGVVVVPKGLIDFIFQSHLEGCKNEAVKGLNEMGAVRREQPEVQLSL